MHSNQKIKHNPARSHAMRCNISSFILPIARGLADECSIVPGVASIDALDAELETARGAPRWRGYSRQCGAGVHLLACPK